MSGIRQGDQVLDLLVNGSATTAGVHWAGGTGIFTAEFSGGTVKLQVKTKNGTWLDVGTNTTFDASNVGAFTLHPGAIIRVNVSGASAVYAYAHGC